MVGVVPWFIDNHQLRKAVWLMAEAIAVPILDRLDQIMGALVTVDSDVLGALSSLAQTVDTEVGQLIEQGKIAPGDVTALQAALADAKSQLDTAVASGTATSPTDPSTPGDPAAGTIPSGDGGTGGTDTGTDTPADPAAPADPALGAGDPATGTGDDGTAPTA